MSDDRPDPSGRDDRTSAISTLRIVSLAVLLVAIGPVSLGVAAPALPSLAVAFGASVGEIKLTLTAFLVGLASTQLICGPLADAFGRRPVTIFFLGVYSLASLAIAFVPSVEWMLFARFVQGAGAAVGWSMARAVVRDLHEGRNAGRVLSLVGVGQGVLPALAPAIGGGLFLYFAWPATFLFMLAYGCMAMIALLVWLPETRREGERMNRSEWFSTYARLASEPRLMGPSLVLGLSLSTNYAMLVVLPFVLIDQVGLTPVEYGNVMLVSIVAYVLGSAFCGRLFRRYEAETVIFLGLGTQIAGAVLLVTLIVVFGPHVITVVLPFQIMLVGSTMVVPSTGAAALTPFSTGVGAASGLLTFIQVSMGLLASLIAAAAGDPVRALMLLTLFPPALALLTYLVYRRMVRR